MSEQSYSTNDIAKRLGVSPQTVQRWVDSGRLNAWKTPGGHRRIDAGSAELLFEDHARKTAAKPTADQDPLSQSPQTKSMQVVIVDDDPIYRELMSGLVLQAHPRAEVQVAGNGFQGLMMIARFAPVIVVTDVRMPHMDGFEMIRNVLADAQTRPQLMVAVSAKSPPELAEFGQLPTEVRLLRKPIERESFLAALREI